MQLLGLLYDHKNEFVAVPDGANRAMVASLVKREWIEIKREGAISYVRMTGRGLVAYRTADQAVIDSRTSEGLRRAESALSQRRVAK
jgi:hypothetical protein